VSAPHIAITSSPAAPERLEELVSAQPRRRPPVIGLIAVCYLLALVVIAGLASFVSPHDPIAQDLLHQYQRPAFGSHLLGTDRFGRDELSRLIYGARISLLAALIGTSVAIGLGAPLGMIAGFLGKTFDAVASFYNDALMSVPALIFALTLITIIGSGFVQVMIAVGVIFSPTFFRLSRAATMALRNETFIEASVSVGCTTWRTTWRHVLPNAITPIVVQGVVVAGQCVVAEAALSFLGFGVQPPTASWGSMLSGATQDIYGGPFLVYFPGIAIASTVLAFSLAGDWLRATLSPHRRGSGS
jgi:peptide/nickel transport system permease protein